MMTRPRGRHAAPRKRDRRNPGPITTGIAIVSKRPSRRVALLLRLWPILPVLFLLVPAWRGEKFAHHADIILGLTATLCLLACLTVTPLMTVMKSRAAKLRWWYGVWMFTLGMAGLTITLWMGHANMLGAAGGNSVNWTGMLIVVLLLPMTVTANAFAQKALGPEWKRWQRRLVWTVWVVVALHLVAMESWLVLGGFAAASVPLIFLRRTAGAIKAWRSGGYSTGGWWSVIGVCAVMYLAGIGVLVTELGVACAETIT